MSNVIKNSTWKLAHGKELELGSKSIIMGILNVTPDSFSDGGKFNHAEAAIAQAERMADDGAAIIDIGGESTRPGADLWGFQKDPDIAATAQKLRAGCCAMHTGRERTKAKDVIEDQLGFLNKSIECMKEAGIANEHIVLDPGFGFAKDPQENIEILVRIEELHTMGFPLLIGTSRKRFIGHYTGRDDENRDLIARGRIIVTL